MSDGEFIKQNVACETDLGFYAAAVIYSGNILFEKHREKVRMGGLNTGFSLICRLTLLSSIGWS